MKFTEFGHATGAIFDKPDHRDFKFSELVAGAAPYDWTKPYDIEVELGGILPIKDQGQSFSCGGQAWSTYMSAIEASIDRTIENNSAKFIYSQTAVAGGGSAGRDNCDVVTRQGDPREDFCPSYQNGNPPSEAFMVDKSAITIAARADASSNRALSYATVAIDIDSVAQAIIANHGVVIGVVGANNGTWRNEFPVPPKSGDSLWFHWIFAGKIKMVNGIKYIGIFNSWGKDIGNKGWQWLSEDYFNTKVGSNKGVFSCWTLVYNPVHPSPDFKHSFNIDVNYGESSDEVKALQTALQVLGMYKSGVPVTGFYGDITRSAVLEFQERYVSPEGIWQNIMVWLNQGKHTSGLTRAKLNKLFA